jgi:hypothetical protein
MSFVFLCLCLSLCLSGYVSVDMVSHFASKMRRIHACHMRRMIVWTWCRTLLRNTSGIQINVFADVSSAVCTKNKPHLFLSALNCFLSESSDKHFQAFLPFWVARSCLLLPLASAFFSRSSVHTLTSCACFTFTYASLSHGCFGYLGAIKGLRPSFVP